ncbi:MAG: YdcF family protein [Bacteroidetes bacterium]|nr:YdcF family protein [Bacteroidota bacterium]
MTRARLLLRIARIVLLCVTIAAGLLAGDGLTDEPGRADVALVPGNTVNPEGSLSGRVRARLDEALRLYRSGYFPLIVVSGGIGREERNEATAMAHYLADSGVPRERIILDNAGMTHRQARAT